MKARSSERFVRFPTRLMDLIMRQKLSGSELKILLWVIRQSLGWNRPTAPFTWYRMAAHLRLDRSGVLRAGKQLIASGFLRVESGRIGIMDCQPPATRLSTTRSVLTETGVTVSDDEHHLERCEMSANTRRSKDSSDKTNKEKQEPLRTFQAGPQGHSSHESGAAVPVPGKYDSIS